MRETRIMCIGCDDPEAAAVMARLRSLGYSVSPASLTDAYGRGLETKPDLIIADISGAEKAGIPATTRKICGELDIPLLFLVSADDTSIRQELGPFGHVSKTSGERELEMAVEIEIYRHDADRQMRESLWKLEDITSAFGEGMYILNEHGELTFMNPEARRLLGWTEEDLMGKKFHDIVHAANEQSESMAFEECLVYKTLRTGVKQYSEHEIFRRRDGSTFPAVLVSTPVTREGKVVASITAFKDLSAGKKAEEEMLNIKKLEAVGILAGGIAHDFNNLLTAIIGNISFAKMFVAQEDRIFERLAAAEKAAVQAKDLTYQLMVFARGGEAVRRTVYIGGLIRDSADFATSGSNIRCDVSIPEGLSPVEVDTSQMRQVILNLVTNAREAMPGGGTVEIRAEEAALRAGELLQMKEGAYVKISVKDHGAGIPAEYMGRIFDPYFTTKEMGTHKGTGFGLAVCHAIIRNHGGLITVESEVGKGTTFYIYLPASEKKVPPRVTRREMPLVGKGKVLIMDDEEIIRLVTGNMLSHIGYKVSFAKNGEEAIDAYRKAIENGEPFDVVILDLTVRGGMGGGEAIRLLREMDPGVRAIVSSGYSRDPVMLNHARYGFSGVLPKPYKIQELFDALQSAMLNTHGSGKIPSEARVERND